MIITNPSGSTVAADFITPMFGCTFAQGAVPAGSYPKFSLPDGTACPMTMVNRASWTDGSLEMAGFLLRIPAALAAGASVALTISITTTAPGSSSRSLADFSSGGTDLMAEVTGLENLSGTWTSRLNQGITDNDDVTLIGDGAAGKIWKVRQQFMQAGNNHGQLEGYWYLQALQNAAGGLAGIRFLPKMTQPWFDVDIPAKTHRAFTSVKLKNGASVLYDFWANYGTPQPFTYPVPATFDGSAAFFATPSLQFEGQTLVRLSGTTLPNELTAGTSYFVALGDLPNMVSLYPADSARIASYTGTVSGDAVMRAYPYLTHFGSLFLNGPTGKYEYLQAGGTMAVDAPVRIQHDASYLMASKVLPCYEVVTPAVQTAYNRANFMTMGPVQRAVHTTGERPDIGVLPSWYVSHLLSQRAVDEQNVRVVALAFGQAAIALYSSATKTIKPLNEGTYAGMPASSVGFRWAGNSTYTQGFTGPTGALLTGIDALSFDHMPCLAAYAYIVTGEPQYLDMVIEIANQAICYGYTGGSTATSNLLSAERNAIINGKNYFGVTSLHGESRTAAWGSRDVAFAAAVVPNAHITKQYFKDVNAANYAAMRDYTDNVAPAAWRALGLMHFNDAAIRSPWMDSYFLQEISQAARMTENTDALYMASHAAKGFASVYAAHGAWHVTPYRSVVRTSYTGPLITSMAQVAYYSTNPHPAWTTGTNLFTIADQYDGYTLANGDVLMWDAQETTPPAGLTACVPYFVINKSGSNFQLSLTAGGAPVAVSGSGPVGQDTGLAYVRLASPPATSVIGSTLSAMGYLSNIRGALKLAQSAGATVSTALIADLTTRGGTIDYTSDPKYNFSTGGITTVTLPADNYSVASGQPMYIGRAAPAVGQTFDSVAILAADSTAPVTTANQIMVVDLHGTGQVTPVGRQYEASVSGAMAYDIYNKFKFNAVLTGLAGQFSLRPIDDYGVFPGNFQARQSMHCGFWNMPNNDFKLIHAHRLDGLMRWLAANFTDRATGKDVLIGASMGAWGVLTYGLRHPELFAALYPDRPRWRSAWNAGYIEISDFQTNRQAKSFAAAPLLAAGDGTGSVATYMDMIAYVSNPANDIPPVYWNVGWADGYSIRQDHVDAVAALRATNRVFAFAWNDLDHSGGSIPGQLLLGAPIGIHKIGRGCPLFTSHSLDKDPAVDAVGGINIGLTFDPATLVETSTGWSCAVTSVVGACTVMVEPKSKIFTKSVSKQLVTISAANSWVTVSFS